MLGLIQEALIPQRVHVPIIRYLAFGLIVIIVQVLGRYMIIEYLDPVSEAAETFVLDLGEGDWVPKLGGAFCAPCKESS